MAPRLRVTGDDAKSAREFKDPPGKSTQTNPQKQLTYLTLRACQLHAVQCYEPCPGHGAHVQSRTSLFSLPLRGEVSTLYPVECGRE